MKTILIGILLLFVVNSGVGQEKDVTELTSQLQGTENGHLVIAGSDEDIHESGGLEGIEKIFQRYGFINIQTLHTRDPLLANTKQFTEPIQQATGIWFMGGRQWRLADSYLHTRTHDEILKLLERGGVVGGSSAGASIMGSYLVRGDTKTNVVMMGDHEEGLGLLTNCAIDQHLLALNRQFDLLEILKAHPDILGIGLDENTAIVVHNNEFEVIGKSYVAIYDGTVCKFIRDQADWSVERPEISKLPVGSERFYLLDKGRKYSLKERRVLE